ncbi:hypothetical protein ACU5EH_15025 [Aliivibrio salmonicida]|uniref:hypothetical protein n=1 Tax=Aliivibrio salmonicida TaxID=40269 RepID=UPI00406C21E4
MIAQKENLETYVAKYSAEFDRRLKEYNATGQIKWADPSWAFGEKGIAWLKETKNRGIRFSSISNKYKGLKEMDVSTEYQDFMKAYHMQVLCSMDRLPSGSVLERYLLIMKRWYYEMVEMTNQTHPMYLTANIIHASMDRHKNNSNSASNVSDYCDIAVTIIKHIRKFNLTLVNIEISNKYPYRNRSNGTNELLKAQDGNPEHTNDSKLISIRAFMSIIELVTLGESMTERLFYNMLTLSIITGFRFQEVMLLTDDSLIKKDITNKDKRQHAIDNDWPTYRLGIKYLGVKKAGWRIHWLAPTSYPIVKAIYTSVKELTAPSRETIKKYRLSNFTNFLPDSINNRPNDMIECRELENVLFTGTGGKRKDIGKSIRNSIYVFSKQSPLVIPVHSNYKNYFYTKEQLNNYIYLRYSKKKNFTDGHQCVISTKDNGNLVHLTYEALMFIIPDGSFSIDFDLISLVHPMPLDEKDIEAWLGGNKTRKSIFDVYNLTEDDGSRISMGKHFPRHNINTFLAIADVTDHIQAILMGRIDISQNKYYQHRAESQEYQTAALAMTSLENAYEKNKNDLYQHKQLSLFSNEYVELEQDRSTLVSRRMSALAKSLTKPSRSGMDAVKQTASILIDPKLKLEHNLKQNLQTYGETTEEIAIYIENTISENFLPELKNSHHKLLQQIQEKKAKELLFRHAKLHPLEIGGCTRDVARWGCPHAMKCQSGIPCGYFTLTGRMKEDETISIRLSEKHNELMILRELYAKDQSYELALKEQEEALIVLKAFEEKAITSLKERDLISLLSNDKSNPLIRILERVNTQTVIGKTPKTLADLFFIEQKRINKNAKNDRKKNEQ